MNAEQGLEEAGRGGVGTAEIAALERQVAALGAELERERSRAHASFMAAPHAAIVSDLEGVIAEANRAAGDLLGVAESRLPGMLLSAFVAAGDRRRFDQWARRLAEGAAEGSLCADCGGRMELELRTFSRDRTFPCELVARPMNEPEGAIRSIGWTVADLGDRRAAEMVRGLRDEIRGRDQFLAMLGHELRNPLAAIALAVDLMGVDLADRSEGRLAWTHRILARNSRQLGRLVDDLMDVSLVTHGKLALASDRVDLREVVGAAAETMQSTLAAREHQLAVVRPRHPVLVRGDACRLAQVVINLLDNAAKYTAPGGHLEVAVRRAGERATIAVRDDGIGIPAAMLERVFEPFQQIRDGTSATDRARGLGLGLALVKQLVQLHHGTVRALSPGEGRGSTFLIDLPLAVGDEEPASPAAGERCGRPVSRLLVVDDDADAADLLALVLRARGYQVDVACDGRSGLERARAGGYQVALVDLGLPDIDGYQVCRQLRRDAPALRLIALTGYGDDHARDEASSAGFHGFLVKPASADAIERAMQRAPQ